MAKVEDLDLYGTLNVDHLATKKEILKSYRKQALKCHPDKNPDNPKAAELFHQLTKALEILTDEAARAAYDKALKAKKAAELRHKELNSKRKKLKEDLEAREKAAFGRKEDEARLSRNLQQEIERLRKEGSHLVEEEKERLNAELKVETEKRKEEAEKRTASRWEDSGEEEESTPARLKVRWKAKKTDPGNGGYNSNVLTDKFSKYGEVTVLVSAKKSGSAVVEFTSAYAAELAVENEVGLPSNPLTLSWLSGQPTSEADRLSSKRAREDSPQPFSSIPQDAAPPAADDFESLVLRRMRQAEERRQLEEQLQADEGDT